MPPYRSEFKASIVIRDESVALPGVRYQGEVDDIQTAEEEFGEIVLSIPFTVINSTYSLAKAINFGLAGLNGREIFIKTDRPISIIQAIPGGPPGFFLQPVRSLFVGTYTKALAPTQIKFINASVTPANVKVIFGSKN